MNIFFSNTETTKVWDWNEFLGKIINWVQTSGLKLIIGLFGLMILFKIINFIAKIIRRKMQQKERDVTITSLVYNLIRKLGKLVLFILFLGYVGIDTAGIGSIIASCAVAIGLALQGSLSNIAGWVIIIVNRPIRIGDYVECQGVSGTVEEIQLFHTNLRTPDNKVVIVPNGPLANGNIINYSIKKTRRVDLVFSISYDEDVVKSIKVIQEEANKHELVLKDQDIFVRMTELADSSIDISCRVWVKNEDYWTVYFDLLNNVKVAFDNNNIKVPYNTIDVNINK